MSLSILKIPTAKIFEPLLSPARYKGIYGGRGSGKSHFFGELLVETCQAERGTLAVCIREAQRTLAQSSKRLIESKIENLGLGHGFKFFSDKIATPGDGVVIFRGMQDLAVYNNSDGAFYLQGFFGNPYNVPLAGGMDYWGTTVPNSSFAFPIGQAISRTTYASLFAIMGTTYGNGDGSTTFNLPDKTGRVSAMKEAAATRLTSSYFGGNSTLMGAVGGTESHALTVGEIPSHQHSVFLKDPGHTHSLNNATAVWTQTSGGSLAGTAVAATALAITANSNTSGITIGSVSGTANDNQTATAGGGGAHAIIQPTIICNYMIRII